MSERTLELDQPVLSDETANALRSATDRAERAEAELARLKAQQQHAPSTDRTEVSGVRLSHGDANVDGGGAVRTDDLKQPPSPTTAANAPQYDGGSSVSRPGSANRAMAQDDGEEELRKDPMMAHLLDSLNASTDVGHYGRLVFAMVARHFLPHNEVMTWLTKDRDFSEEEAAQMLHQVEGRDYSPPRRERLLEWQSEQEFQFIDPHDPDSGNLYRNLKFPQQIYDHIGHYQDAKATSEEAG